MSLYLVNESFVRKNPMIISVRTVLTSHLVFDSIYPTSFVLDCVLWIMGPRGNIVKRCLSGLPRKLLYTGKTFWEERTE